MCLSLDSNHISSVFALFPMVFLYLAEAYGEHNYLSNYLSIYHPSSIITYLSILDEGFEAQRDGVIGP